MPRRRIKGRRQVDRETDAIIRLSTDVFVLPVFRLFKTIASDRPAKEYRYRRNLVLDILCLACLLAILLMLWQLDLLWSGIWFLAAAGVIAGLLLVATAIRLIRRKVRSKYTVSDVNKSLDKALHIMDSTAKWYRDEDAANVELVACLKSLGMDAEYRYILPNGRIVDARLGNGLIEGKLSPDTSEVDRLVGQLSEYTPYGDKLHIVIYGLLSGNARQRIEAEITNRYLGKVFLVHLPNPKRLRAGQFNHI